MKDSFKKILSIIKAYYIPFLISLCCVVLLITAAAVTGILINKNSSVYPETLKYSFFGEVRKLKSANLLCGNTLTLDLGEICMKGEMSVSGSAGELRLSSADGSELAVFTDGSDLAVVNGYRFHMECAAKIDGARVYVPLSFVSCCINGINVTVADDFSEIKIERNGNSIGFSFKSAYELARISDDNVPAQYLIEDSELDYDFLLNLESYKTYLNPDDRDALLLYFGASKKAESSFVPANLVNSSNSKKGGTVQLNLTAAKALEAMILEMEAEGISGMYITRGYQSYDAQKYNYDVYVYNERYYYNYNFETTGKYFSDTCFEVLGNNYLYTTYINNNKFSLSLADAETVVTSYCAAPGTGDHITGLGMDLHDKTGATLEFAETEAYRWLCENAYKFGFIERFPSDRTKMTGFHYEPYHWRFVGQYHAAVMHREGYCFEEYLSYLGLGG